MGDVRGDWEAAEATGLTKLQHAALEDDGLIERRAHPTDGRQMLIRLMEKGALLRQHRAVARRTRAVIARLGREERAALREAAVIMKRARKSPAKSRSAKRFPRGPDLISITAKIVLIPVHERYRLNSMPRPFQQLEPTKANRSKC